MKKLVFDAPNHGIIALYIDDSIQNEYAPDDAIASILKVCVLKNYDANAPDHSLIAQIISDSIRDKDLP